MMMAMPQMMATKATDSVAPAFPTVVGRAEHRSPELFEEMSLVQFIFFSLLFGGTHRPQGEAPFFNLTTQFRKANYYK